MRTRLLVVAVLALGMRGGVAARAEENPSPVLGESHAGLARDGRSPESSRLTRSLQGRDDPTRLEAERQERLDELDEARINGELLEMEVEADKQQIRKMMGVLRETELLAIQGFSQGPVLRGNTPDEAEASVGRYKKKLAEIREDFVVKSKALGRERRRVAELEGQLHLTAASAPAPPSGPSWDDAGRILDLLLMGVDTWRRAASPSGPPLEPKSKDADRLLDLIRKGVETLQGEPSPPPSSPEAPVDPKLKDADRLLDLIRRGVETLQDSPLPSPTPTPPPSPAPEELPLKDAERVLELLLKGVENWQRR